MGALGVLVCLVALIPDRGLRRSRSRCRSWRRACADARPPGSPGSARSRSELARPTPPRRGRAWSSGSSVDAGSPTSACSRRWRRVPRELFVPESVASACLRRRRASDRPRADDLAAVRRRDDLLAPRPRRRRARPRRRHGLRLPGSRARRARGGGRHDRADPGPRRDRARSARSGRLRRTSRCGSATARSAFPSARRSTRSPSRRRLRRFRRRSTSSSPRAGGSSSRAARVAVRTSCSSCARRTGPVERRSIPCRFVPLLGDEGFGQD